MSFTLACAQFRPEKAKVEQNLDRIGALARQAAEEEADVVLFPETATTGYFLEGGVLEATLTQEELRAGVEKRLGGLARPIDLAIGFYERHEGNLYNSCAYLEVSGGAARLRHVYRKFFLPTYGVFDEERFVSRGRDLGVFETRFGKMGILICEDVWHSILSTLCAVSGAQLILIPSASPARGFSGEQIENLSRYERMVRAVSEEHGVFCANCQLIGFEGGKGFIGGSSVADPFGRFVAQSPVQEEHLLLAPIDFDLVGIARAQLPLISDLQSAWADLCRLANKASE
jgi:N-carbamoylputrescine amidase